MHLLNRLVHSSEFIIKTNSCNSKVVYENETGYWILLAGSVLQPEPTIRAIDKDPRSFEQRKIALNQGIIDKNILRSDLKFSSLNKAANFASLRAASSLKVSFEKNSGIALVRLLSNPSLYNEYIAHCKYYDYDWNVIYKDTEGIKQPESVSNIEQNIAVKDNDKLDSFKTVDLINEILNRLLKQVDNQDSKSNRNTTI